MVSDVKIRPSTLTLNARVQETGGPLGQAKLSREIAGELRQERDNFHAQAVENAYLKGQTVLSKDLERIENEHKSDPDALSEALDEYGQSFLDEVNDPEMSARFELQLQKAGQSAIARATAKRKTIINEQARFDNLQAFESIKARLPGVARGLLSTDTATALAAREEMQEILMRGSGIVGTTDADGVPLFNASFRSNQLVDLKDTALQTAASTWIENQPDKVKALETFENGELSLELPDGQGGFETVNLRDSVSPQTARLIQASAKAQIAEQKAAIEQQRSLTSSNIELAIELAADDPLPDPNTVGPPEPVLTKAQKLGNILQQIDNNPLYTSTPEGIIKGNTLRKKVFSKLEKEREDYDLITAGSAFASGQAFFNRQDTKAVQALDKYYETVEPGLAQLEPFERNLAITDMLNNTKGVPKRLTGDIQRIARSNDIEQIAQVADLVDRVSAVNPHMVGDLAPQKDLARVQMINERINQGYEPEEAIKIVDELLDPRNEITIGEATAQLKEKKVDYRGQAVQAFDSAGLLKEVFTFGFANGLDTGATGQAQVIDGLSATYRVAYEDHYRITRDEKLSQKYAENFVRGQYGTTDVNGSTQIMQYAPEKYYSIQGSDNKWMRQQAIEAAQKELKNSFVPLGKRDLNKNLLVMPHPFVTPRTAKNGAPRYKLMLRKEDGSLMDVLGPDKFFFFEPDTRRKELIDKAEKRKQIIEEGGDSFDQMIKFQQLEVE